jgi:RHS repeat-associated protein
MATNYNNNTITTLTETLTPNYCYRNMCNDLFNAKELDEENGMYYYSARYYNPPTFISRDPLFEKYPFMSPYAYCSNNPVNKVDPTGLYDKESQAQKAQEKAVKRYGKDNVGSVYQNDKGKYEFRISKTGFKQERGDNIPKKSDAYADGGKRITNNFKQFFYNIINGASGGYHFFTPDGQNQETRQGDGNNKSLDGSGFIRPYPDPIDKDKQNSTPQGSTNNSIISSTEGNISYISKNQYGSKAVRSYFPYKMGTRDSSDIMGRINNNPNVFKETIKITIYR